MLTDTGRDVLVAETERLSRTVEEAQRRLAHSARTAPGSGRRSGAWTSAISSP
ncbi:hypothetical protein ACEZDB_06975 [Streptacidiphilus sp. N1-3]|uniref:HTH lysR-type domain-containing protein n=1 Tax=Streptacidiphilus alkalitolerans TaxID=3342712 RepID=A0ABV6WWK1_9ACTN